MAFRLLLMSLTTMVKFDEPNNDDEINHGTMGNQLVDAA